MFVVRRMILGVVLSTWLLSGSAGRAQTLESFEYVEIGHMPPAGWLKWQEAGGRGWSNSYAGRQPMPGWMNGTNTVPPDPAGGSRLAYVTYTHGGAKTNDLWLISPILKGVVATSTVSFWYRSSFSNFADSIRLWVSTNATASRRSDFTNKMFQADFPRGWPNQGDFPDWTNYVINIGALVPAGTDIRLGFQEYWYNNWYDVRANEMDVIRSDLWSPPVMSTIAVRAISPTSVEVDFYIFNGYPAAPGGVCYGPGPNPEVLAYNYMAGSNGYGTVTFSNLDASESYYFRTFVRHSKGTYYGNDILLYPGDSEGEGYLFESFEEPPIGQMPPPGWRKWEEAGGRGWSNSYAGRRPMPGWMSGTNTVPPDPDAGSRMAYVTYTHGGAKTNDLWLISPTIKNTPSNLTMSFWYRSSFSNFADSIRVWVTPDTNAYRKANFPVQAFTHTYPRGWPNPGDFPPWTNFVVDIGSHVAPGSDIRIGIQEYHNNNWYDVRANEMDVVRVGSRTRYALQFDGVDDEVTLPLDHDATSYTIEAWIKPLAIGAQSIILRSAGAPMTSHSHQLRMTSGGNFEHDLFAGGAKTVTGSTTAQIGKWYHVVGTARNSGTMRLYVNGVEEGTATTIGTLWTGGDRYEVGAASEAHTNFNGLIDEVRIWDVERTANDIRDTMNVYLRGVESGLRACYRFDRTFETDVEDSSYPAHSTYFGPATESDMWAVEDGWRFDGVDDLVTLPQSSIPPDYTIEAWVQPSAIGARNIMVFTSGDPLLSYFRQLRMDATGHFQFYSYDGAVRLVTGTTIASSNTWYHIAGTAQNGGTMRLYVNGVEENSGAAGNTLYPTGGHYQVGTEACWSPRYTWFKGTIRGVSITNRARTATEFLSAITDATNAATSPVWVSAETPLGDHVAAEQWNNRGLWELRTSVAPTTGLAVASAVSSLTNFVVCGHNNRSGVSGADVPAGFSGRRLGRVWYMDVHGETNPSANLTFTPSDAGASSFYMAMDYDLIYRTRNSGAFSLWRSGADSVSGGDITFNAVTAPEGYYSLALAAPSAPEALSATGLTAFSFYANWNPTSLATNYYLDVASNIGFSAYVAGYSNLQLGTVTTRSVTGLLASSTYCYRLRAEHAGGTSTNSGVITTTTLPGPTIGILTNMLSFSCTYGTRPADQTFGLTNSGSIAYLYTNEFTYSAGASGWLSVVPVSATVDAYSTRTETSAVSCAAMNAGTYYATNVVTSPTATNSPQSFPILLTINKADQTIAFPNPGDQGVTNVLGLAATATSGLTVAFSVGSGPASIVGANAFFSNTGVVSIVASQAGNSNWNAAADVTNTFNVFDNMPPAILGCPGSASANNSAGLCAGIVTWTAPTATDNVAVANFISTHSPGDTFNVGTTVVSYVATDTSGNSSTCSFAVVVADAESPSISGCPGNISTTNTPGSCSAVVIWTVPTADDNCSVASFTNTHDSGDTFNVGTTRVTYVAADAPGQAVTCSFDIVVADVENPTADSCPGDISTTNTPGACSAAVSWTAPSFSDNCAISNVTNTHDSGDTFNVGTTRVTYVASDAPGFAVTCSFDVVIADVEFPSVSGCPADINTTNTPGSCDAVVTWTVPNFFDNCAVTSTTNSYSPGDTFNVGTTLVAYVARDLPGNTTTCRFQVVVADVELPVISDCPADISTTNIPGSCDAVATWTAPTADDNCGVVSFTNDYDPGDTFPVGTTFVHCVAADLAGNAATCTFEIVVADVEPPAIFDCPSDISTTNTPGSCDAVVSWVAPTASDNCVVTSFTNTHNPGDTFSVGTTRVVYVAADTPGLAVTCSFDVVVADVEDPVISGCPTDISTTNAPGYCDAAVTWVAPTASDNSGVVSYTNTHNPGDTFNVGTTRVVYVAADAPGLAATCSFDVVVADVEDPVISGCPADINTTNTPGSCDAVVTWVAPTASDNCDVISYTNDYEPGDTFSVGTTRVHYVARDLPGHSVTCAFDVIVADVEDPIITCPADITTTNDPGICGAVAVYVGPTTSDNCPGESLLQILGLASGATYPVGVTTNRFRVTDVAGNTAECEFEVTVNDIEPPVISGCPSNITVIPPPGAFSDTATWTAPTADDNCAIDSFTSTHNPGDTFTAGDTLVTYEAVDTSANTSLCTFTVSVEPQVELRVTGFPEEHGAPQPFGYGTNLLSWNEIYTNTVPLTADESNGTRYAHGGFGLGNLTSITNGPGFVVFQATTNGLIQWNWREQHYLSITSLNGSVLGGTQGWHNSGRVYDLVPSNSVLNYVFDHWVTNSMATHSNVPLNIIMDDPKFVEAFFRALFIDCTDDTTANFTEWHLNLMTGTMLGTLELCNRTNSEKQLTEPFWYVADSNATLYLMHPDGTESNSGLPYIDMTTEVLAALPDVGNADNVLDPGECVLVPNVEFYSRYRTPPAGYLYAIWADPPGDGWIYDEAKADTDRDGIANEWEDTHDLDKNDPLDGSSDSDEDGASNLHEYKADTDPQNRASFLQVGILHDIDGALQLEWIGGSDVTQYLEQADFPAGPWLCILTNIPPTDITNRLERESGRSRGYYRIRIGE